MIFDKMRKILIFLTDLLMICLFLYIFIETGSVFLISIKDDKDLIWIQYIPKIKNNSKIY